MKKTLNVTDNTDLSEKISDVKIYGRDLWTLLCKASSKKEGWSKSTKAMEIGRGCLVQVTTYDHNAGVAEAITYVPLVYIQRRKDGSYSLEDMCADNH